MIKVVASKWWPGGGGQVGIVITENEVNLRRTAFIGAAYGTDEGTNTKWVLSTGSVINVTQLQQLIVELQK